MSREDDLDRVIKELSRNVQDVSRLVDLFGKVLRRWEAEGQVIGKTLERESLLQKGEGFLQAVCQSDERLVYFRRISAENPENEQMRTLASNEEEVRSSNMENLRKVVVGLNGTEQGRELEELVAVTGVKIDT